MTMTRPQRPPVARLAQRLRRHWDGDLAFSFRRSPVAILASTAALTLVLGAVLAPWLAPHNPFDAATLDLSEGFTPPGTANPVTGRVFLLGSDGQGRDLLSAILYGSRVSLLVGFASVLFSVALGLTVGLLSGYVGGRTDAVIMRIADVQLSFPAILIALMVFGIARGLVAPAHHENAAIAVLIVAIGLAHWPQYARAVRGSTLVEKNKDYVLAARIMGRSAFAIMRQHLLPNVIGPVMVIAIIYVELGVL
jgi:peptide/nickel transport system permease protein